MIPYNEALRDYKFTGIPADLSIRKFFLIMNCVKEYRTVFISLIIIISVQMGCASGAMEAVNRAHAAINSAREVEAEKYAPVEMALAVAAFDLAESSIMEGTISGYKYAKTYAEEAEFRALSAKQKAEIAIEDERLHPPPPPPPPPSVSEPPNIEDPAVLKKRYIAQARRRILNSALADQSGKLPKGRIELEAWITSDGRIVQILVLEGDAAGPLAAQALNGLRAIRMDPFPPGMKENYLKIRVKIDTLGEQGKN